ncbi:hypothetical protein [Planctomicrobium sp. SH527]|uniref:hypothetical protein n=1 Tax=Planctomicrobium sp. SH527 TaxID=3448123 RepID=UPI003F5CA07A
MRKPEETKAELIVAPPEEEIALLRKRVLKLHQKFLTIGLDGLKTMILCGVLLQKIKDSLKHGQFKPWLEKNFEPSTGLGVRTAQRYMAKANAFLDLIRHRELEYKSTKDLEDYLETPVLVEFSESVNVSNTCSNIGSRNLNAPPDPNDWESPAAVIAAVKKVLGTIQCDPCALTDLERPSVAEINYSAKEDGLSEANPWEGTAWICPGHETDAIAWYEKARSEMARGVLQEAIICLPESTLSLPGDLFWFPVAITPKPLTVTFCERGTESHRSLPTRSLFVYMAPQMPDAKKFARAFEHIAAVFAPVSTQ